MAQAVGQSPEAAADRRLTVLLVEDEPSISKVVGSLLDEAGYRHVTIADHDLIPGAVERWHPQCVILDSEPPANGAGRSWADAAAIRRAHPDLPVLMFTADNDSMVEARTGTSERSAAAGFAGVMDKPFLVLEFLATLKHAVQNARRSDAVAAPADAITIFPALTNVPAWSPADFFSTAVHELRTPLTSILGQAQLALRYVDSDPARARIAIQRTIDQSTRMNRLVSELLDHARVTVGALSLQVITLDLGATLAEHIQQYELDDAPRITLRVPAAPTMIRGDPDRIAQIMGNLLDNAIKYSPPNSPIGVSVTLLGGEAQVRVQDEGIGVPLDERDRIFAPFYRTTRTRDIPGTGLGLHISRRLAEQHRGRLWLDEATGPATGTVFTLALPLA